MNLFHVDNFILLRISESNLPWYASDSKRVFTVGWIELGLSSYLTRTGSVNS
jgi:hypothetical protein